MEASNPAPSRNEAGNQSSSQKISSGILIAVLGVLGGLLGGVTSGYFNLKTEGQKARDQAHIEQGKAQTQLDVERMQAQAQIDLQRDKSRAELEIERTRTEGTLRLEKEKQDAAANLAKQEFETKLIMQAVQGVSPDVAAKNLKFFLQAGFISDPSGKIARLSAAAPPSLPSPNGAGIPLKNPRACTELAEQNFTGAATPMTERDIQEVAASLHLEPAALQAIIDLEVPGEHGFHPDGRPFLVYYQTIFSRLTASKYDSNPGFSMARAGVSTGNQAYEHLRTAMSLDCGAALAASSWGLSQLTGANYQFASFETVDEFIRAQMTSERAQLETLGKYLQNRGLLEPLQKHDWESFARKSHGNLGINEYVSRLSKAYEQHKNHEHN
jgi:N-acetylmuramidase